MEYNIYINNIKNSFKSKEYWFGFSLIVISCVVTSIYNLAPTGIFGDYNIGSSEFFIAGTMYSNTLLQISAPIISIFVCMNRNSLFMNDKEDINRVWRCKEMRAHILSITIIGGSIFLLSFLFIFLLGVTIFPPSTGSMQPYYGLFKEIYSTSPISYVFVYIAHSFICGAVFSLFGISIKLLTVKPNNLALFIPLIYYACFERIGALFPIKDLVFFVAPLFTFDISLFDISLVKRGVEIFFVLATSLVLIISSYWKNVKKIKL